MNTEEREKFWDVLKDLHDNSEESMRRLSEVSKLPRFLCRFRSVSENSLQQLQENKLFFSSADYYDDPFDTYFYINYDKLASDLNKIHKEISEGKGEIIDKFSNFVSNTGESPDKIINALPKEPFEPSIIKDKLRKVRDMVQQGLFSICFCEDPYNETLWLKYANNYSGFVQIYDFEHSDTILCGKEEYCQNCNAAKNFPYIYPIYYSDEKYDASNYALGKWLIDNILNNNYNFPPNYLNFLINLLTGSIMWDIERISLIKKKCHENDQEWRMIRPEINKERSFVKMKPCKIIIGLRTPKYERRLIVSAAQIAGIKEIHELKINDKDELVSEPITEE